MRFSEEARDELRRNSWDTTIIRLLDDIEEVVSDNTRVRKLLHEWIAAAQSGDIYFGKVLQEPRPERLRQAIASAIETQNELQIARSQVLHWKKVAEEVEHKLKELSVHIGQ